MGTIFHHVFVFLQCESHRIPTLRPHTGIYYITLELFLSN